MTSYTKLRAVPDMDTRDCEYVNARIAELLAALRSSVDMLQECMRNADNDTADAIDAVLIEAQRAIANATKESAP